MNRRIVFYTVGKMVLWEAALFLLPLAVSILYGESCWLSFVLSMGAALAAGGLLMVTCRTKNDVFYAREGFAIVAVAWIVFSAIGALPFIISGEIPRFVDAWFETVSGFTTTGASIVPNVELLSKGILFWRSFTHWVGGMGILVFVMALVPANNSRTIHIMRAEMPGPVVGKLVPRAKDTAALLYKIYIAMTLVEILLLICGGMPVYDSIVHSFGTAGTGGFGIKADSIAGYSPYLQWVITVFMLLFGVNFNVYFLVLAKRVKNALQSTEMWVYFGIVLVSVAAITVNILPMAHNFADALRLSAFQVSSIITTTGFATTDFNLWPGFSKAILLLLMFIGACAGSTGGGIKVSRVVLLWKMVVREIRKLLHPRSVNTVKFEGKTVDDATLNSVGVYLAVYIIAFALIVLLLCLDQFNFLTNFSAAAACYNNIGPGMDIVGPTGNFAAFTDWSKLLLSLAMLLGRLEIFPILIALLPATWHKK